MTDWLILFALFTAATFLGVLGSQLVARFIAARQIAAQQRQALAAFQRILGEDCGDPNCEIHGNGAQAQPTLKN